MTASLHPKSRPRKRSAEERYRFLSGILESFAGTLELRELLRRISQATLDEFDADRVLLLHPIGEESASANVRFSLTAPGAARPIDESLPARLTPGLMRRALTASGPIVVREGDPDADPQLQRDFCIRSAMLQVLRPRGDESWAFGIHDCRRPREWTEDEISLFAEIGRYATLALANTLLHDRALREMAKVSAILDQIPEPAAIYDANGGRERMNAAATREPTQLFAPEAEGIPPAGYRNADGTPALPSAVPAARALRGESVRAEYRVRDSRGADRIVHFTAGPIRDTEGTIIGAVVVSRDVTEEREEVAREERRRTRAECLATLGLDPLTLLAFDNLDGPARRIADAVGGSARIYFYRPGSEMLEIVGYAGTAETETFRDFFRDHPYRPGEGLPGTAFQIGRPLLFSEVRGNDVIDFGRDDAEKRVKAAMHERSLVAAPIESYGERIGALVVSQSETGRNFSTEDVEFVQTVAERIGSAAHVHRLTRISLEGHRAAEELARSEVDARVRLEGVLETAPVGIAVISADELRFEMANARWIEFATLFGRISAETRLLGLRVDEVIPGLMPVLRQVAESGETQAAEVLEIRSGSRVRYVNRIVSAARGRFSGTTQSVTVLVQDVSEQVVEERATRERESRRRRHAECLANIGLESVPIESSLEDLSEPARRIAEAIGGTAFLYRYLPGTGELRLSGMSSPRAEAERFRDYLQRSPYHAGEGIPGTVFQIGRPLLFSDVKGTALLDFGRDDFERSLIEALREQSLIASPIESYGEPVGAIVVSRHDDGRNFDAEDLEFVQSVAERLGAAIHIHELTRISQEGHRAAEDLARREVDARVRFEAVLETAPIGIAVISADELRFELANARWLEFASLFGKVAGDTRVDGLRIDEVIAGWDQTLKGVADSGEMRIDEAYEIPRRSGGQLYINRIISPVRGRFSGVTQSLTVLVQDVTEQIRARHEIEALAQMMAERSARLDSILGSMTDALWVYDARGEVVDVNQAGLTMFGIGSRNEAIALGSFEKFSLRHSDGRRIVAHDLPHARALAGAIVPDFLAIGRHLISGKDLDLSIAAAPIESNGVVGAVLVIRDITALQELDRKKDEFLSVASHELRTPLTTIKGYTQLLAQIGPEGAGEERATYLNSVLGEIDRMMGLITELLDVSRIETNRLQVERQQVRWLDFLQRRATAFRVQNPGRVITFHTEIEEVLLSIDPNRMRQVIDNLLSNAIKYSPEASEVTVHVSREGGAMHTAVVDRGIGIPADEIPRLFDRFHRARNVSSRYYGGLGLGLYIAKAIVEAHGGSIAVSSTEGEGATFTIRLPL